jgi:hypothetical protein
VDAAKPFVAGVDIAIGIMGHAQDKPAFDLGKLIAALVAQAEPIELAELAARIDPAIRPPGHGFGVVQDMTEVGKGKLVVFASQGWLLLTFARRARASHSRPDQDGLSTEASPVQSTR